MRLTFRTSPRLQDVHVCNTRRICGLRRGPPRAPCRQNQLWLEVVGAPRPQAFRCLFFTPPSGDRSGSQSAAMVVNKIVVGARRVPGYPRSPSADQNRITVTRHELDRVGVGGARRARPPIASSPGGDGGADACASDARDTLDAASSDLGHGHAGASSAWALNHEDYVRRNRGGTELECGAPADTLPGTPSTAQCFYSRTPGAKSVYAEGISTSMSVADALPPQRDHPIAGTHCQAVRTPSQSQSLPACRAANGVMRVDVRPCGTRQELDPFDLSSTPQMGNGVASISEELETLHLDVLRFATSAVNNLPAEQPSANDRMLRDQKLLELQQQSILTRRPPPRSGRVSSSSCSPGAPHASCVAFEHVRPSTRGRSSDVPVLRAAGSEITAVTLQKCFERRSDDLRYGGRPQALEMDLFMQDFIDDQ